MKLKLTQFEQILSWNNDAFINELVIENKSLFRQVITELYQVDSEKSFLHFTQNGQALDYKNDLDVITNPCQLNFTPRTVMANLFKKILQRANSENNYLASQEIKSQIDTFMENLILQENYNFEFVTNEITIDQLAKILNLRPSDDHDNFIQALIDYMEVMSELGEIKLQIFINMNNFLDREEYQQLCQTINYHQLNALFISSQVFQVSSQIPRLTIDRDMCEI